MTPQLPLFPAAGINPASAADFVPNLLARLANAKFELAEAAPFSIEWAAGFMDGEGCIHVTRARNAGKAGPSWRLGVSITQNHRPTLEHFHAGMGVPGHIYPTKQRPYHSKQPYALNYTGAAAMTVIALLLPHLVRKHAQAMAALEFWVCGCGGLRTGSKGLPPELRATRERLYRKVKSLK